MLLAMPTGQVQTFSLTVSQTQIPPVMNPQASSQPIGQRPNAVSVRIMIEQTETATSSRRGIRSAGPDLDSGSATSFIQKFVWQEVALRIR